MNLGHRAIPACLIAAVCLVSSAGCERPLTEGPGKTKALHKPPSISHPRVASVPSKNVPAFPKMASPSASISTASYGEEEQSPTIRELDGDSRECEVYSYKSRGTYSLEVDFEGAQAKLNFPNGGYKYVDIDDPDGTDFTSISATDSDGESWEITVSDPPQPATEPEGLPEEEDRDDDL